MPPRLKRSATHDKTNIHSAGLAPPGRRIPKQKSNGNLNGHPATANGRLRTSAPPAHPDAGIDNNTAASSPTSDAPLNEIAPDAKMGAGQSHPDGRSRTASGASDEDLEAHGASNGALGHAANGSPLRIDVKAASGKCALPYQKSALATAATILKACPLWDVIAILIILLQLPPTIISVVQFLFALLTFVPPASGTSLSNLPSINEVLLGASGAPSFQTIILVDVVMFVAFVSLWTPAQNLALDLAQAVIAISLGGAAASKGGTSNSIFCSLTIIGLSHLIRMQFFRQFGLNAIWAGLIKLGLRPSGSPPTLFHYPHALHASVGLPRKLLGVHILTQGVVRLVRRWYLYSAAMNEISTNKKIDPEVGTMSALSTPRTNSSLGDPNADTTSSASTDGRPPGPSPANREKDRISNTKKKKKQANHVRSQQPFWAALANAKVTFLKELEHQQASADAMEANAMDAVHIGNANFKNGKDRVWIREVGSGEISFGVCLPSLVQDGEEEDYHEPEHTAKRFRVRLNKTDWSSTRINEEALGLSIGEEHVDVWNGKIFGLTASTNYICEFIRVEDGAVFYTTHITTQPAPSTEQVPSTSTQPQSLRPLSPTTTLKNSIQAAEQQLEAHRNRLKRNKRDHKNVLTSLQREVDSLNSRLSSNGGNDDRQRQKVRQLEQSMQQAKAKEAEIMSQIDELGEMPADEMQESNLKRASWQQEKDRRSASRKEYNACKAEADREISQVKLDISNLVQKRQRFEQRQTKYNEQHSRLISETNQSQEAQARRIHEREIEMRKRTETERRYVEQTTLLDREAQSWWLTGNSYEQQVRHLEELFNRNVLQQSEPPTPEGPLPGTTRTMQSHHHMNGFPTLPSNFQFPLMQSGFNDMSATLHRSNPTSLYREGGRHRSSSMLSGVSGFTDELEDYPLTTHTVYPSANGVIGRDRRKSSAGSGSASTGSGNSSTRDPMSPAPKSLSPGSGGNFASPISPPPTAGR